MRAVDADGELETVGAFAMFFGPDGPGDIQIFLPPLGPAPVCRHGTLSELPVVVLAEMLFLVWYQGGINNLPTPGHIAVLQELPLDRREQGASAPAVPIRLSKVQIVVRPGGLTASNRLQKR